MNICHIIRVFRPVRPGWGKDGASLRAGLAVLLALLLLAGCTSSAGVVETWEGSPGVATSPATLKTPAEIRVSRVNGRTMTNFLTDNLALDYALLPGQNEVVFVYKTIWAKSGVAINGESKVHVVESKPQVVRFEAIAGETYRFEFKQPDSRQEAERMMPEFSATIVSSAGDSVASSTEWNPAEASRVARTPIPESRSEGASANDVNALGQLKAVWATASDEEKKAFLRWVFD